MRTPQIVIRQKKKAVRAITPHIKASMQMRVQQEEDHAASGSGHKYRRQTPEPPLSK
jgi:hypothetical protein